MTGANKPKRARRSRTLIQENLKKVYQETEEEEIPDALKNLLERLKRSDEEGEDRK
ncbi:MAG: NepR family anti-sigma factor [Paracoccaceae bacterium]